MNAKSLLASLVSLLAVTWSSAQPQPGTVLWTNDLGNWIVTSPALGPDGTIYVGTSQGLFALTNEGTSASVKWNFAPPPIGSPAVGLDGTIYFIGGPTNALFAVNPDGSEKWSFFAGGGGGTPAIGWDGTIYFAGPGHLFAVSPSGELRWQAALSGNYSFSSPVVSPDWSIYISSYEAMKLFAFDATGNQKWARDLPSSPGESIALGVDGIVYLTAGTLHAYTPAGEKLWNADPFVSGTTPVVTKSGTIVVKGMSLPNLFFVSPDGQWVASGPVDTQRGPLPVTPAIDAAGVVWLCASNAVWALDGGGEILPWSRVFDQGYPSPSISPVIGNDGVMYAVRGLRLYAIVTSTNGPIAAPWPMLHQNSRHTGKVEKPALLHSQRRSDANFQFQLYWQLGQTNVIETSTNLISWTPLTNVVITNVPMDVIDLTASNSPTRFYRAIVP